MNMPTHKFPRKAVYAGSFDPITNGHIWVIEEGLRLFDHLYIVIGTNAKKKNFFSVEDRIEMIQEFLDRSGHEDFATVLAFENRFMIDVVNEIGADYMLRGIRNAADFAYEMEIKEYNAELRPEIETVFLAPPANKSKISSSLVRGMVGLDNWVPRVNALTTDYVTSKFKKHLQQDL